MWRWIVLGLVAGGAHADVVVIGNSIALHPPKLEVGWMQNNGMAASSEATDYAHLIGASQVFNLATLERGQPYALPAVAPDTLVVQLGDNATDVPGFTKRYADLLRTIKAKRLICVSTWWQDFAKDAVIFDACTAARGEYVYIGDLFMSKHNPDRAAKTFTDNGVNEHPHDWGMARIAERVRKAMR